MNKFEAEIDLNLANLTLGYEFSYEFEGTKINYVKPEPLRVYTPDFTIRIPCEGRGYQKGGFWRTLYIETKGYFRPEHRTKMRHVKRCNPSLDIRIIFQKNLVINKKTGFDYLQWAKRNDFPCAIGHVPKEWLE